MRRFVCLSVFLILILTIYNYKIVEAQNWSVPVRISGLDGGYYPKIIAQGDTLHVLYEGGHTYEKMCYQRSTNGGQSWSDQVDLLGDYSGAIFPQIVANGPKIMCLWHNDNIDHYPRINYEYRVSTNYGQTWGDRSYILGSGSDGFYTICVSGFGDVVNATFAKYIDADSLIFYNVRSTNFGQTWSAPHRMFRLYQTTGSADQVSISNYVYLVFSGSFSRDFVTLLYTMSSDSGSTWTNCIRLNAGNRMWGQEPAIAVNQDSVVGVVWAGYGWDILIRQSFDFGNTWDSTIQITHCNRAEGTPDIIYSDSTLMAAWGDHRMAANGSFSMYFNKSLNYGIDWDGEQRLNAVYQPEFDRARSESPALATSNGNIFAVWYDAGPNPDSTHGLYFSRWIVHSDSINEKKDDNLPLQFNISSYPNPFNSTTTISFSNLQDAEIKIYDIRGALIKTLRLGNKSTGSIIWDGTDNNDRNITSGVYFARAYGKNGSASIKLIYLK